MFIADIKIKIVWGASTQAYAHAISSIDDLYLCWNDENKKWTIAGLTLIFIIFNLKLELLNNRI